MPSTSVFRVRDLVCYRLEHVYRAAVSRVYTLQRRRGASAQYHMYSTPLAAYEKSTKAGLRTCIATG